MDQPEATRVEEPAVIHRGPCIFYGLSRDDYWPNTARPGPPLVPRLAQVTLTSHRITFGELPVTKLQAFWCDFTLVPLVGPLVMLLGYMTRLKESWAVDFADLKDIMPHTDNAIAPTLLRLPNDVWSVAVAQPYALGFRACRDQSDWLKAVRCAWREEAAKRRSA